MLDVAIFCLLPLREYNPPRKDGRSLPHSPFVCQRAREKFKKRAITARRADGGFLSEFSHVRSWIPFLLLPLRAVSLRFDKGHRTSDNGRFAKSDVRSPKSFLEMSCNGRAARCPSCAECGKNRATGASAVSGAPPPNCANAPARAVLARLWAVLLRMSWRFDVMEIMKWLFYAISA